MHYYASGGHGAIDREEIVLTDEVFQRSYKFVVDTGLDLARDHYDCDQWAARQAMASMQEPDD